MVVVKRWVATYIEVISTRERVETCTSLRPAASRGVVRNHSSCCGLDRHRISKDLIGLRCHLWQQWAEELEALCLPLLRVGVEVKALTWEQLSYSMVGYSDRRSISSTTFLLTQLVYRGLFGQTVSESWDCLVLKSLAQEWSCQWSYVLEVQTSLSSIRLRPCG